MFKEAANTGSAQSVAVVAQQGVGSGNAVVYQLYTSDVRESILSASDAGTERELRSCGGEIGCAWCAH